MGLKGKSDLLKLSASAAAMMCVYQPALAQDSTVDGVDGADAVQDVIVVSGIRKSLEDATAVKRNSTSVVDAIAAEDIGKFPDTNIAESLQRITGVQINRERGEGNTISIRGLPSDFVQVRLNNVALPNAIGDAIRDTSRTFDFAALPSELVRTLEVHKTPSASLEEGGLAGTVIIRTPRPFDFDRRILNVSAEGSWESNSDQVGPKFTALYSDKYGDGNFGITAGFSYQERNVGTQEFQNFGYNLFSEADGFTSGSNQFGNFETATGLVNPTLCDGTPASRAVCSGQDFNGNGVLDPGSNVAIPFITFNDRFNESRERISGILSAQWAPSENLEFFVDGFYTRFEIDAARAELLQFPFLSIGPFLPDQSAITNVNGRNVVTTFAADNIDTRAGQRIEQRVGETYSITGGAQWANDVWTANLQVNFSKSEQEADNLNIVNSALIDSTLTSNPGDSVTAVEFRNGDDQTLFDPNAFRLIGVNGEFNQITRDELVDVKFDVSRDLDLNLINKIHFGAQYSDRSRLGERARLSISAAGLESLFGDQPEVQAFIDDGIGGTASAAFLLGLVGPLNGEFLPDFPQLQLQDRLAVDTRRLLDEFTDQQLIGAGTFGVDPTLSEDVSEEVFNAYVQADFANDDGTVSGNFGVRFTRTEQTSRGSGADLTQITFNPNGGLTTVAPLGVIDVTNKYSEILPSANIRWEVTEDFVARFGASRTLTRPRFTDISPTTVANVEAATITGGNPSLDPFIANNFDLALEYYFGGSDIFAVTFFHKDIVSLVRTGSASLSLPVTNALTNEVFTANFTDRSPTNGVGATLKGVEVSIQKTFDELPGLLGNTGVIGNYTYINNSDPEAITAASENNFNIGGFYEDDKLGVRLSYTWRDEFLSQLVAFGGQGAITEAFGTLDGSINYNVRDNISAYVEGVNLTDQIEVERFTDDLPFRVRDNGRRLFFGVRASL